MSSLTRKLYAIQPGGFDYWVADFAGISTGGTPGMVDTDGNSYFSFQDGSVVKMSPTGSLEAHTKTSLVFKAETTNTEGIRPFSHNQTTFARAIRFGGSSTYHVGILFDSNLNIVASGGANDTNGGGNADGELVYAADDGTLWTSTWDNSGAQRFYNYNNSSGTPVSGNQKRLTLPLINTLEVLEHSDGDWVFLLENSAPSVHQANLSKWSKAGTRKWEKYFVANSTNQPYALGVAMQEDSNGNIIVFSSTNEGSETSFNLDGALSAFNSSGTNLWNYNYDCNSGYILPHDMVVDSNDDTILLFYESGTGTHITKISTSLGTLQDVVWDRSTSSDFRTLGIDSDNNLYVSPSNSGGIACKLPADGDFVGTFGPVSFSNSTATVRQTFTSTISNATAFTYGNDGGTTDSSVFGGTTSGLTNTSFTLDGIT